jgi:hypothetical protein
VIDIGDDLVGAYLSKVLGCPIVQFNVRTGVNQAEIDVVGLQMVDASVSAVWCCEVSTHTSGLGGYRGQAARKIATKLASVRQYAEATYPGVPLRVEVWSPKVTPGMLAKLDAVWAEHPEARLVANDEYAARVRELSSLARQQSAYSDSPSFRLLQILTRLPSNPLVSDQTE